MEEKEGIHKGFKIFLIVFTIAILIFINRDRLMEMVEGQSSDFQLVETLEDGYNYRFFKGELIRYDDKTIAHLETFDELTLQKELNFTQPMVYFADKYIYYGDGETGDIYIFDSKLENIGQFNLKMKLFNIYETDKYLMIHNKEDKETLYSINNQGGIIYKNTVDDNMLNYDMGPNTYAFVTVSMEDDIISTLHLYDFQGNLVDTMDFDNQILFKISYVEDNLVVLSDKTLYMIHREILWEKDYSLIKNIMIDDDNIFLLYSNYLETLDHSGQTIDTVEFQEDYDMIESVENSLILHGDRDVIIMEGDKSLKLTMEDTIENLSINGNQLIVNTENYTNIYEFDFAEN